MISKLFKTFSLKNITNNNNNNSISRSTSTPSTLSFCLSSDDNQQNTTNNTDGWWNDNDYYIGNKTLSLKNNDYNNNNSSPLPLPSFIIFDQLGDEIKLYILSFLPIKDLFHFAQTSKTMMKYAYDKVLWVERCRNQNGWSHGNDFYPKLSSSNLISYYHDKSFFSNDMKFESIDANGSIPSKRYKHSATVFKDEIIYIGGQESDSKRFCDIVYYNTKTNKFTMPKIKGTIPKFSRHTAQLINDKIYVYGGYNGMGTYYDLAIFDPIKKKWENISNDQLNGDIPLSRSNHTSVVIGDMMYIIGGNRSNKDGSHLLMDDMHCFDTKTKTWTNIVNPKGQVPCGRGGHCTETIDGKIYLFGGGVWDPSYQWTNRFNDLHVYNPVTNEWSKADVRGDIVPLTSTFSISFVYGSFFYLFGGGSIESNSVTNQIYAFDTLTNTWQKLAFSSFPPKPRDMSTASVIKNNVFIFGGYAGGAISYLDKITFDFIPKLTLC